MDDENPKSRRRPGLPRTGLAVELWDQPEAKEIYLLAGWRQWADAGSVSSGLPRYLAQQSNARPIGQIHPDGFYIFQIPGTHDLLRPMIKFDHGYSESLEVSRTDIYYTGDEQRGLVIVVGDEPHLDIERYTASFLHIARTFNVRRIISLGGVYGELPYNRERPVHGVVSRPEMRAELERLAITPSEYQGGASIGSYLCKRAGDAGFDMLAMYAFVPSYDFSGSSQEGGVVRIENDFTAWLGVMRRLKHMLSLSFDLTDLEGRHQQLLGAMEAKMAEIDQSAPQLGVLDYLKRLSDEFEEISFRPDDDFWEEKLRGLFDEGEEGAPDAGGNLT